MELDKGALRMSCRCWTYKKPQNLDRIRHKSNITEILIHLHSNHSINNCESAIERKLRNLSCGKLSEGVSKFHNSLVLNSIRGVSSGSNTVVSGFFNLVVDCSTWIFQVNSLGKDQVVRGLSGIFCEEELGRLIDSTPLILYRLRIADIFSLG